MYIAIPPFWVSAVTAVKFSVLDLYIELLGSNKTLRKVCFATMGSCALFWIYDMLATFLICRPLAFVWNKSIPGGRCGNTTAAYIVIHSINFVTEVFLAILPIPVLWGLQMPTRKKLELSIMFGLGTLYVRFQPHKPSPTLD